MALLDMLERYLLQAVEKPPAAEQNFASKTSISVNHEIAITDEGKGIAQALAMQLNELGYRAKVVTQIPVYCDVAILLNGLCDFSDRNQAINSNLQAFNHVKIIAERFTYKGGYLISVQDTGGQFGLSAVSELSAWAAGFSGLLKTAAQEWPKARCKIIDLQCGKHTSQQLAARLVQEILQGDDALEVGLLIDARRIVLQTYIHPLMEVPQKLVINKQSVIVVSAGARGVTAACIIKLAEKTQAHFVLLGRTPLMDEPSYCQGLVSDTELRQAIIAHQQTQKTVNNPKYINQQITNILAVREIRATLQAIQQVGGEAIYYSTDVLDAKALKTTLSQVRQRFGTITGLIHGAGILADKLITQKSLEQFTAVFNTKVLGLQNLLHLTRNDPLQFISCFSSVAARFGNIGQSDYAMANEVLNKVLQYERQQRDKKVVIKSFNWGPWEGGMVTTQLKKLFESRGIVLLPIEQGAQMFVAELTDTAPNAVEIILGGTLKPAQDHFSQMFSIAATTHPYLLNHVVEDLPVVPACLILEWFTRTIQSQNSQWKLITLENFKVLKGIRLSGFHNRKHDFFVNAEVVSASSDQQIINLQLISTEKVLHYSARAILQIKKFIPTSEVNLEVDAADSWPWTLDDIYFTEKHQQIAHRLFHGPDFYAIHSLNKLSEKGGMGYLQGIYAKKWPNDSWQLDVLALDGVLQLLRLWSYWQLKQPSLPTQINQVKCYDIVLPTEPLQCIFLTEKKGSYRTLSDAVLIKTNGEIYAELFGIEMCSYK